MHYLLSSGAFWCPLENSQERLMGWTPACRYSTMHWKLTHAEPVAKRCSC